MEMPKPGDAHKKLERLIGEWGGAETLHPAPWDPTGGPASARIVNRSIVDGFAVVQEYEQRRGGKVTFRGHGVFWYDAPKQQYVMSWWDSMGGSGGEFRGGFNGDVLELSAPMPQGGQSRASFDMSTPGQYAFVMEVSGDGQTWQPAMEGRYRRGVAARKAGKKAAKKAARRSASAKRGGTRASKRSARAGAKAKRRK
jgi:hypothetical protein